MLRPGVPGLSDNITVRSVVGRFLEHSRFYMFEAGDRTDHLMGSADLITRNLHHRIEGGVPGMDQRAGAEAAARFAALMARNTHAWELDPEGAWTRLKPEPGERPRGAHAQLMRRAKLRARRR